MKTVLAIRHVVFEDLGILGRLIEARGYTPIYADAGIDDFSDLRIGTDDLLVILGGPIGAYEEDRYPFLADELRFIDRCLKRGVRILGICLGAQLLARSSGARVYPNSAKEIGFAPITLTKEGGQSCLRHVAPANQKVLHWHGDTFDLPVAATRLASTAITPNQAFAIGDRVLALQFHIELDFRFFERWLVGHTCELTAAHIDVAALRADAKAHADNIARAGDEILAEWIDGVLGANSIRSGQKI